VIVRNGDSGWNSMRIRKYKEGNRTRNVRVSNSRKKSISFSPPKKIIGQLFFP
jgi:hypothetical protein